MPRPPQKLQINESSSLHWYRVTQIQCEEVAMGTSENHSFEVFDLLSLFIRALITHHLTLCPS